MKVTFHHHVLALLFCSLTTLGLGQSTPESASAQVRKRLDDSLRGQIKAFLIQQLSEQQSPGAPTPPPEFINQQIEALLTQAGDRYTAAFTLPESQAQQLL